jgi:argininosuccinate lyase
MPQKKNPDAAELLRARRRGQRAAGRAARRAARAAADLQQGHAGGQGAPASTPVDTLDLCLQAAAGMLEGIAFDR